MGIEKVVVEPAVDDVDPLRSPGGPEEDLIVLHEQVLPEDQLDAHVPGQEAMLEVGRVVRPRREQDDRGRVVGPRRRDRAEGLPEVSRIILDPPHAALLEELGKHLLHHHPVLDHVADPGGAAAVVLEDQELAAGVADQVGADDVHVLLARRAEADHLGAEALRSRTRFAGITPSARMRWSW